VVVRIRMTRAWRAGARMTADLLIVGGAAGVLFWLWGIGDGFLYQQVQARRFTTQAGVSESRETAGSEAAPGFPRPAFSWMVRPDPRVVGRLEIPSIGLSVMVRDGVDEATLRKAVGRLPSSARPGQAGNFVLLGHRDTFFRPLRHIARGAAIHIRTRQGDVTYIVDSISVVSPEFVPLDSPSGAAAATLITCFPFTYAGPAPRRMVVQARLAAPVAGAVQIE
jgi:LPXTG-site transpeptidase (sortase) family protein